MGAAAHGAPEGEDEAAARTQIWKGAHDVADPSHPKLSQPCPVPPPTLQDLNMYTQGVWNGILHFLVGERTSSPPPDSVLKFISDTGLMVPQQGQELKKDPKMVISSKGYDFMLKDVSLQVWR